MTEEQMVRGDERLGAIGAAGRVHAGAVPEECRTPRLVHRGPHPYAIAKRRGNGGRVVSEVLRGVTVRPAARVLQHLWKVPVIEREDRGDAVVEEAIDEP